MVVQHQDILGLNTAALDAAGGGLTAREIAQQPQVWPQIDALVAGHRAALDAFLAPLLASPALRIVLTGAGTSAFLGECLAPAMLGRGWRAEAVPTTDIVSGPGRFLQAGVATLVVSFARSGSSPESVAAVQLADQLVDDVYHLVKNTPKVTGFLGSMGKPQPISEAEAARILNTKEEAAQAAPKAKLKVDYEIGDQVKVLDGPFASFNGTVEELDFDRSRVKVSVSIFGRATPVELEFEQVERVK